MFKQMTRSKLIQVWFATVALVLAAGIAFGVAMTVGTVTMLLALCLVPPALLVMLWPAIQPPTIAEVLHDAEQRN